MFSNEPLLDFSLTAQRASYEAALLTLDDEIRAGKLYSCPIIAGKEILTGETVFREDPSHPKIQIGKVHYATVEQAREVLLELKETSEHWRRTPVEERAALLEKAATELSKQRLRFAALITREAGKPWREADADVAEAIDFCRYYAEQMRCLGAPRKTMEILGEDNFYLYKPRGVAVVIAPWNFPLAIACGMTVAALVTGNTVVLKPAEQTSIVAFQFMRLLLEVGFPEEACMFLPGQGETVGAELVGSPLVDLICFTGSKAVGLEIIRRSSELAPGQMHLKRVIAELGGKNAIIVDDDADLDEAIKGVIHSAFGFAGQKCSACSRVVVVGSAYEPFMQRLCDAAADIIIGPADKPNTLLPPVIDQVSQSRILETIRRAGLGGAESEGKLAFKSEELPPEGYFVPATIFRDVSPTASIWREEIFGPVVACLQASNFEAALELANDSQYALTGGLFSRTPSHIALAKEEFMVGNLYINRGCTGALVCRQPFGGFKLSGIGSKAGGSDYLLQFMEPRTITENTMRRGFTPESK